MKQNQGIWITIVSVVIIFSGYHFAGNAFGETAVGGVIDKDTTWRLAGSPYVVKEDLWIRSPATLTMESGVRVQFDNGTGLIVYDGSLKAKGTSNQPITFTSLSGRTNGWRGILFSSSKTSDLTFCIIEKAGEENRNGIHANVDCRTDSLILDNCTIRESGGHGLYIQNSSPRIENCQISGGEGNFYGVLSESANSNPTLIGNTFKGGENALRVGPLSKLENNRFESKVTKGIEIIGGTIGQDRQWTRQIGQSTYTLVKEDLWIRSPATLTMESGVRVQFDNGTGLIVYDGSLKAKGTSNQPITFTSLSGRTNGWRGILFSSPKTSDLTFCIIEKAGEENRNGIHANVDCRTDSLILDNCTIREGGRYGLYLRGASPRIENCQISGNNTSEIIYLVSASPSLTGNAIIGGGNSYWLFSEDANSNPTLIGNTFKGEENALRVGPLSKLENNRFESKVTKGIEIIGGTIGQDRQWTRQIGQSTYTLVKEDLWIRSPATLTMESGVRVQFDNGTGLIVYDGSLKVQGISSQPITFTSLSGKTNGWRGILFSSSQPSNLTFCIIEKAGEENRNGIHANIDCRTDSLILDNCTIGESGGHGLYIRNARPIINTRNRFLGFTSGGGKFALYNDGSNDIDATNNYWGTENPASIAAQIFDKGDDNSKGTVNHSPFLSATDFVPAVPALLAPTDGTEVHTATPLLQWEAAAESLSYVLQIAKESNFNQILLAEPMLNKPNYLVPDGQLVSNQTYYWRVKAENYIASSGWSKVNSLRARITDGEIVPTVQTYTMTLEAGINLAAVPVQPETEWKLSNLAEYLGLNAVSFIVWHDKATNQFLTYMPNFPPDSPANIPVRGGEGYMIVMTETKTVRFTGTAWGNAKASPPRLIARSNSTRTPLFVVSGMVLGEDGTPLDNISVAIKNLNTGGQIVTTTGGIGGSGRYVATLSDLTGNRAAQVGDGLEVSIIVQNRSHRGGPIQVSIPNEAIRRSRLELPPLTLFPIPKTSALLQNYPNPFNPETWIPYQLAQDTEVVIQIYDIRGRLIRTLGLGKKFAGFYVSKERAAHWDGTNDSGEKVASGVYFYTIRTKDFTATRRLLMAK